MSNFLANIIYHPDFPSRARRAAKALIVGVIVLVAVAMLVFDHEPDMFSVVDRAVERAGDAQNLRRPDERQRRIVGVRYVTSWSHARTASRTRHSSARAYTRVDVIERCPSASFTSAMTSGLVVRSRKVV